MSSTTIEAFWSALQSGYYDASAKTLLIKKENGLNAPAIDALLADAGLFPGQQLAMTVDAVDPPGSTIVLGGTLTAPFLGFGTAPFPRAVATFSIGAGGEPQLSLGVAPEAGKPALLQAFPALKPDSQPAVQMFTSAIFTAASSAGGPSLDFAGTPDIAGTRYAKLWAGTVPSVAGAVTSWQDPPAFMLASEYAGTQAEAGLDPMEARFTLVATAADAEGSLDARLANAAPAFKGLTLSQSLKPDLSSVALDSGSQSVGLDNLGTAASLFMGQQLAALIPSEFNLGTDLSLSGLTLDLAKDGSALGGVQLTVTAGVSWNLLPDGLLNLTGIGATFLSGSEIDIAISGNFDLGGKPELGFTTGFWIREKLLTVRNTGQFDVGKLLDVFHLPDLKTGLVIEPGAIGGSVSIPDQSWSFDCDIVATGWSIDLMGDTKIAIDTLGLKLERSSASLDARFSTRVDLFGSKFDFDATYGSSNGWMFSAELVPPPPSQGVGGDKGLYLSDVTKALLPFDFSPPVIILEKFQFQFSTTGDYFFLDTVVEWDIDAIDTKVVAELQVRKKAGKYEGFLAGEVDIHGLVLLARYDFSPTSMGLSFAYRALTVTYRKVNDVATVSISLGRGTVGDLFDFFLSFAEPGRTISLGGPWSAFEKIELPAIVVDVNLTTKAVRVELDQVADLGFLNLKKLVVNYSRPYGSPSIGLELDCTFLGQEYGGNSGTAPLKWDALNDSAPAVPGAGSKAFDLEFLGLGQRVAIAGSVPTEMDKIIDAIEAAMRPPADPSQNPAGPGSALSYDAASNWLIGSRFTVASTLRMDLIFNDPVLYGLLIQLSGEKAAIFAGLRFEILYRKVTDTIGVYHIELTLPDVMRHLEFGEVSITLPIVTLDIYTNGDFRVDFGFPPSLTDFSRSFSIQVLPFTGFGGFYFALLDGETSSNVPKVVGGHFGTVLEFGVALQVGVGKTLSLGVLSGGISITVGGEIQGVLAWYSSDQSNLPAVRYHRLTGMVAVIGKVYASIDFGIIQASVSLTVYASVALVMESYKAMLIEVSAGVSVAVSIKIIFIRIDFSFKATITESFLIGSDSVAPWTLAPPGSAPGRPALRARGHYLAAPLLVRQPRHNLLRRRSPRRLALRSTAAAAGAPPAITVAIAATPLVSQALSSDFAFKGGPTPPSSTTTPVLALLLTLPTSDDPAAATNLMMGALLTQLVSAIGHEQGTISAAVIDEILHSLSDPAALDDYFGYDDVVGLITGGGISFAISARPEEDGTETRSAVLAMIPELALSTPDYSIDFGADRKVDAAYEAAIRKYFAKLTPSFAAGDGGGAQGATGKPESIATFLFRYQFYLLAKSAVEAARDLLALSHFEVPATGTMTLNQAANLYNNDYLLPAAASFAELASLFGISGPELAAANPDLPPGGPGAGDLLFVPAIAVAYLSQPNDTLGGLAASFGLEPTALQDANPGVDFNPLAAGTKLAIPAVRIVHSALAGENAADIAREFAVGLDQLAAANPKIDLNLLEPGTELLIPRRLTALSLAAANQDRAILAPVKLTLGDIHLVVPANGTPARLADTFGCSIEELLEDNQEAVGLFAAGQAIALGDLQRATRDSDSLDGLALYWYGTAGDVLDRLAAANPGLTLKGQSVNIPRTDAKDEPYDISANATFAAVLAAWPGLTLDALIANNQPIVLNPGQPLQLPAVDCVVSPAFDLVYTATGGDSFESIAAAFFAPDKATGAALTISQINRDVPPTAGSRVIIPYATSPASILRQYGIGMADLAAAKAVSDPGSTILAPGAPLAISGATHVPSASETFGGIAQTFGLSLEQLVAEVASSAPLAPGISLTVPAIPGMDAAALCAALGATGKFTNALNLTSRFLLGGLRVPAPDFVPGADDAAEPTFPLYALAGQEFPVAGPPPADYSITLTAPTLSWLSLPDGKFSFPLAAPEVALITAFASLKFDPKIAPGAALPLPQFSTLADCQPPQAILWWQSPELPGIPVAAKAVRPSIWSIPAALGDAVSASPRGELAYRGTVGTVAADGSLGSVPLAASRYATMVDLTVEKVPGSASGVYSIVGTDQAGLQRLIALWLELNRTGGTAEISFAYASQASDGGSGTMVSDQLDRARSAIIKTNLSTLSNAPPAVSAAARGTAAPEQEAIADLTEADGVAALQFLWECSSVRSGGFYLRYVLGSGEAGLPDALFKSGNSADLKLIVAGSTTAANVPALKAYHNVLIAGDNVDPGHDRLAFEALTFVAGSSESLTTAAQAIAQAYPNLPHCPDAVGLARVNQLVPGTLVVGTLFAGEAASPDDSFRSLALRAEKTVDELASALATSPCLRPGARFELMGEPVEPVAPGATLAGIAEDHSFLDPASLSMLNAGTSGLLAVGETIVIPGQPSRPIVAGETLGSIAKGASIPVTLLGLANATLPILAENADIVVAADSLRTLGAIPAGHSGFTLDCAAANEVSTDPPDVLAGLYHMLGFALAGTDAFTASGQGLPATPTDAGTGGAATWHYRQMMAIAPFAARPPKAIPEAFGPAGGNPYSGIADGAEVAIELALQDVLGNRTDGSVLAGPGGGAAVTASVSYCDEVIALSGWPSLRAAYAFASAGPLEITLGFAPDKFLADASTLPPPPPAGGLAQGSWATRSGEARSQYLNILYQLLDERLECAVTTTLGPVADAADLSDLALGQLRGLAGACGLFLRGAEAMVPTLAGAADGFATLAALVAPGTGYPVSLGDLAAVNSNLPLHSLFGTGPLLVPAFSTTRAGETAADILGPDPDPAAFAAANADVPVAAGVAINTASRAVPAGSAGLSLAAMAQAMNCPLLDCAGGVSGLASANSGALLEKGTILTFETTSFTAGDSDTLASAAAALGGQFTPKRSLTPEDVAAANLYVAPLFASGPLAVASALTVDGDSLATLASHYGPAGLLALNLDVPGLWPASTSLETGATSCPTYADDSLGSFAARMSVDPAAILALNAKAPLAAGVRLAIPWSADCGAIAAGSYRAGATDLLLDISGLFDDWPVAQLAADNLNWPGLFKPEPLTLSGKTVTPDCNSTFASLAAFFGLAPADFAQRVASEPVVRSGAMFITPPLAAKAGERLDAFGRRYGLSAETVAAANASLPGLFAPGQAITVEGTSAMTLANDTLAMVAARINGERLAAGLAPVSISDVGAATAALTLLGRTILPPPAPAAISAAVQASMASPIASLAVDLSISRDPALVAPAFAAAPLVVSANCPITAAPFAAGAGQPETLAQFAADFETAFPGLKLATGPGHTHSTPVLAKPSLRATASGGTGASPSGAVRALWVVDLSRDGLSYTIEGGAPGFYGIEPLSTAAFSADDVDVPTYSSKDGLAAGGRMNFRGADPEQWNQAFLGAIDLVLSPDYAAAAASAGLAKQVDAILTAKLAIAKGLATLVAPLAGDAAGLQAARDALAQQLLVNLSSVYKVQSLVQLGVSLNGAGGGKIVPAPRLAGKLTARIVNTPADGSPVDPARPFAALCALTQISAGYLVAALFDMAGIVRPGVVTAYPGKSPYTTGPNDTLETIAKNYECGADGLANLTLADASHSLFASGVPTNLSTTVAPLGTATVSVSADWLDVGVADLLAANAERTDFFAAGSVIEVNGVPVTQGPNDTLASIARSFGDLATFAQDLAEIDSETLAGSYTLNRDAPPRSIQHVPQFSFQSAKAPLEDGATLTNILTVSQPSAQRKLILDLEFSPTQLEFDIYQVVGVDGYEGSSWLSFVLPLDPAPNRAGELAVPIALRGYPEPAVISNQQAVGPGAGGEPDLTLAQWTYRFDAERPFAAQDQMMLEVSFNDADTSLAAGSAVTDRSDVIRRLAGFAAVWPLVSTDLSELPKLLDPASPGNLAVATKALQALAVLAGDIADAWGTSASVAPLTSAQPRSFRYSLSTLNSAAGQKLRLERLGQVLDFSVPPDDFLFLADAGLAVPEGLRKTFADHGFELSAKPTARPNPQDPKDWIIIDPGDLAAGIAPQTYRLLPTASGASTVQVWRQLLWPAIALDLPAQAGMPPPPPVPLAAAQAATTLTFDIPSGDEIAEGSPLHLQFAFERLDAFSLANGWGGFSISRNANLVADISQDFIYRTPPIRFPTRITPFIQRSDPVALTGTTLEAAIEALFVKLFAGEAALDAAGDDRNIRVEAAYWRTPDGSSPVGNPLAQRIPLVLAPTYAFPVASVGQSPIPFCTSLAATMKQNAAALGIAQGPNDCWLIDLVVYGQGASASQQVLAITNHYLSVAG